MNRHHGDVYGKAAAETVALEMDAIHHGFGLSTSSLHAMRLLSGALSGCGGWSNFKIPSPSIEYCNKHINVTLYAVILGLEHVCGPKEVAARTHCFCRWRGR